MHKYLFPLLFLSTISHYAFSQANVHEGYYLTNQGEKVKAFFNLPADSLPYNHFYIYNKQDGSTTKLWPTEATEVMVNEKGKYVSKEINGPDSMKYQVFIEALVKGSASLYYYPLQPDLFLYIETPAVGLFPISNKKSLLTIGEKSYQRARPYANQLAYILKDCSSIKNRIDHTEYDIASFVRLIDDYNKCISGKSEYVNKPDQRKYMEIGPVVFWGGSGFNWKNVRFDKYDALNVVQLASIASFGIGAYFDLIRTKSNNKSSFRIYSYYQRSAFHCTNEPVFYDGNSADYSYTNIHVQFSDIFINFLITRYFPLKNKQRINLEAGPFFAMPLNLSSSWIQYTETNLTFPSDPVYNHQMDLTHTSSFGMMTGIHYVFPIGNTKSFSVFAQGGLGTFNLTSKASIGYKFGFGVTADLF